MSWMNFADAEKQTSCELIPKNTLVKVHMKIRPGGYDDESKGWTGGYATRSENSGAIYLDCEFTVMGGKYNKRKIWSLVGLHSPEGPKWEQMGRSFIRAALESARGIKAGDASDNAMKARQITGFADLDGLEFVAKVDVEEAEQGSGYDDKNKIQNVIGVTHKKYASLMNGQGETPKDTPAPSTASTNSGNLPSWAQG